MSQVERALGVAAGGRGLSVFAATEGHCTVVWLSGHHDASTAAELSSVVDRLLGDDGAELMFDLSGVTFMDSTTVAVIAQAEEYFRARSRSLVVRAPSRFARFVLDPYGLRDFVDPDPGSPRVGAALGSWVAVPTTTRGPSATVSATSELATSGFLK